MKAILFLSLVICALGSQEVLQQFEDFIQKYNRVYATQEEYDLRFKNFQDTLVRNVELSKKNPRATFGINDFADLSQEEFASKYLMDTQKFKESYVAPPAKTNFSHPTPPGWVSCWPNPDNWNWYQCQIIVTPVYNQGQCGSCWAFSATETIESYFALGGNGLHSLAVQQIVSCDTSSSGCSGGWPTSAYSYVAGAGGIEAWSSYPYTSENGNSGQCNFNSGEVVANAFNPQTIVGETGLYQQCSYNGGGPVSVCVDASTWSGYTGGVLTSCGTSVDHCVQLVGYQNYGQNDAYWIVRNQWGTGWGVDGFIYIAIGNNLCDIGSYATVVQSSPA